MRRGILVVLATLAVGSEDPKFSMHAVGVVHPRISPDGKEVAFSCQGAIWRVPVAGGVMRRLTSGLEFATEPAWSPDGRTIAYLSGWEGPIRLIDAETGDAKRLDSGERSGGRLHFHPDGKRLLAGFRRKEGTFLSWIDLATGREERVLGPIPGLWFYALSPDGSRIVYTLHRHHPGEHAGSIGPQSELWVASTAGGGVEKLGVWRTRVFQIAWQGEDLVFATDFGGAHNDLWSLSLEDPTHGHRLTTGRADEDHPSFSGDGEWMAYADNREGAAAIAVRRGTEPERFVTVTGTDFGVPTGALHVVSSDGRVARLSILDEKGNYHAPPGSLYRRDGDLMHFYAREAELAVPVGIYVIRAFRGMEYLETRREVEVRVGKTSDVPLALERWIDPAVSGWYSGESHIHANYGHGSWYCTPEEMRLQIEGEGLNAANFVIANSDGDGIFDREFWRGEPDPVSSPEHVLYWNEEFRATLWGHMTLWNLKHLVEPIMTGFQETTNPYDAPTNGEIADHTHAQGGHVTYTHPAYTPDPFLSTYGAKGLPVDLALGKIDSLDVNGAYAQAVPLWYRLLNCGFRLPASAGTDAFLNRIQSGRPGKDRAYVRIDGPFSYGAWVEGLKAGRSFVTNGPWLEFEAGGKTVGETIELAEPGEVRVIGTAKSPSALERIELVRSGEVVATGKIDQVVRFESGGWLSLRAYGQDGLQAHTSPIYVNVAGKGAASAADARYFLEWIDRLEAKLLARDRLPTDEARRRVLDQLAAARSVYARIAGE